MHNIGERVQIHTDSKGTIQQVRSMLNRPYAKNRKAKSKEITHQIIDTIRIKEMLVVIEWVKGHRYGKGTGKT